VSDEQQLLFELNCLQRSSARKRFRKDIFEAWGGCAYCGCNRANTLDHVIPKAKGGPTNKGNLIPACGTCNMAKSDTPWFLWFRWQSFWTLERETRIFHWLLRHHESRGPTTEYESLCTIPLLSSLSCESSSVNLEVKRNS